MSLELVDTDECDPPTDEHPFDAADATIAGARATLYFHHLHALLATLSPLRAAYVGAAIDPLRALPLDARRAVLPHLLREHPTLLADARVRALADDVLMDTDAAADRPDVVRWLARVAGVRATSANDALTRAERALVVLASAVAELSRARTELRASLAPHAAEAARASAPSIPDDATDVLAWALGSTSSETSRPVTAAIAQLVLHTMAVPSAARDAALDLASAVGAPWWTRALRGTTRWIESVAGGGPTAQRFDAAFARAYFARASDEV